MSPQIGGEKHARHDAKFATAGGGGQPSRTPGLDPIRSDGFGAGRPILTLRRLPFRRLEAEHLAGIEQAERVDLGLEAELVGVGAPVAAAVL
jgi:hypothetical protein